MKLRLLIIATVCSLLLPGCGEDPAPVAGAKVDKNTNPRFATLNPYAWQDLPMEIVIADFQQADGVFSSFICDELNKRLVETTSDSLKALDKIDKTSRDKAFRICLHPEAMESEPVLKAVSQYANAYPELVNEMKAASE